MSWSFTVPGQPYSINHSYRPVKIRVTGGGTRLGFAKVKGLEAWQTAVSYLVRSERPTGWAVLEGEQIRISYEFFYKTRFDADNALKALNDAIANALGVNDDIFLPCVLSKSKDSANPRTVVTISP